MRPIRFHNLLLLLASAALAACSARELSDTELTGNQPPMAPASGFSLPRPSSFLVEPLRRSSVVDTALVKSGNAFDNTLPSNLVSNVVGDSLTFDSQFSGSQSLSKLSYAMYRFDLSAYSGPLDFYHGWGKAPKAGCTAWLGVSNFSSDRWDWFALSTGATETVPGNAQHQAPDGTLFAAVVLVGIDQPRLELLMLGNDPPVAQLEGSNPLSGPPGLTVDFDGSASADPDGNIVDWSWDPEGDGSYLPHFGTGSSAFQFVYCNPGSFQATLRVRDDQGAEDTASVAVSVSLGTKRDIEIDVMPPGDGDAVSLQEINGKPAIAYIAGTEVRYSHATVANGQTWTAPLKISDASDTGGVDLCQVGTRPAVAFQTSIYNLGCAWAVDSDGNTWSAPVDAVEITDDPLGAFASIASGNGLPIISYNDSAAFFSGNVWLARATSSNLSTWAPPIKLNSNKTGLVSCLAWIDGIPSVAYSTIGAGLVADRMMYARGTVNWDVAWLPPLAPLPSGGQTVNGNALVEIDHNPAILYRDGADNKLYFIRADDAQGLSWQAAVPVPCGSSISDLAFALCVVNGVPCVAYLCDPGLAVGGLSLVFAKDPLGNAWDDPIVLDPATYGNCMCLADINGRPCVAWQEFNTGKLRFIGYFP